MQKRITHAKGFTLIELMVSIALLSVVVTIVAAAFTNLLSLNRIALSTNTISNNLNFVVDTMSRSIRTGSNYQCGAVGGTNCAYGTGGSSTFVFKDDQGDTIEYYLSSNKIYEQCVTDVGGCNGYTTATSITDPGITINGLKFYVQGVGNSDGIQPQVIFVIQGQMTTDAKHGPVNFDIESSATQRQIDI